MKTSRLAIAVLAALLAVDARALFEAQELPAAGGPGELGPVVIDPGHGGEDWGAVVKGKREKDIALAIARRLRARLEAMGGSARLTRDSDVYVTLDRRLAAVEDSSSAFISLHLNKVKYAQPAGITIFSFGRQSMRLPQGRKLGVPPLPDPPRETARAGAQLATAISRSLQAQGLEVDPLEHASFYVLKNPVVPSVLIELGYLSNPREYARLNDPAYQDRLAEAIAVSVRAHLFAARGAASVTAAK